MAYGIGFPTFYNIYVLYISILLVIQYITTNGNFRDFWGREIFRWFNLRYGSHGPFSTGDPDGFWEIPGLVNIQKTMERSTIFHGKTHYFNGHVQ